MLKKKLFFCSFVFCLLFIQFKSNKSYGEEYLDTVIEKINKMENDLPKTTKEKK